MFGRIVGDDLDETGEQIIGGTADDGRVVAASHCLEAVVTAEVARRDDDVSMGEIREARYGDIDNGCVGKRHELTRTCIRSVVTCLNNEQDAHREFPPGTAQGPSNGKI